MRVGGSPLWGRPGSEMSPWTRSTRSHSRGAWFPAMGPGSFGGSAEGAKRTGSRSTGCRCLRGGAPAVLGAGAPCGSPAPHGREQTTRRRRGGRCAGLISATDQPEHCTHRRTDHAPPSIDIEGKRTAHVANRCRRSKRANNRPRLNRRRACGLRRPRAARRPRPISHSPPSR